MVGNNDTRTCGKMFQPSTTMGHAVIHKMLLAV
jgi:hypothetical protein